MNTDSDCDLAIKYVWSRIDKRRAAGESHEESILNTLAVLDEDCYAAILKVGGQTYSKELFTEFLLKYYK